MDQPNDHDPAAGKVTSRDSRTNLLLAEILEELRYQNAASGAAVKEQRKVLYFTGGERPVEGRNDVRGHRDPRKGLGDSVTATERGPEAASSGHLPVDLREDVGHVFVGDRATDVEVGRRDPEGGHEGGPSAGDRGEGTVPERSRDTPEPPEGLTHYSFITPLGRPFLSRMLCDLAANSTGVHAATSDWSRVTCWKCLNIGPDVEAELLAMPDAVLVSLGAWGPAGTSTDEVAR